MNENSLNLVIAGLISASSFLFYFKMKSLVLVKDAKRRRQSFFLKHTYLFWTGAWVFWTILYFLKSPDISPIDLSEYGFTDPRYVLFTSDINSALFFGVYFAYLRGRQYNKYDYYTTVIAILSSLTILQLSLFEIELKNPAELSLEIGKKVVFVSYYAPSLAFAVIAYFLVGWSFYRRLGFKAFPFVIVCFIYSAIQPIAHLINYNLIIVQNDIAGNVFYVLAILKIIMAVLFFHFIREEITSENLLKLGPGEGYDSNSKNAFLGNILPRSASIFLDRLLEKFLGTYSNNKYELNRDKARSSVFTVYILLVMLSIGTYLTINEWGMMQLIYVLVGNIIAYLIINWYKNL